MPHMTSKLKVVETERESKGSCNRSGKELKPESELNQGDLINLPLLASVMNLQLF